MISDTNARTMRHRVFKAPDWDIDILRRLPNYIVISGWYISREQCEITVNGYTAETHYTERNDLTRFFAWLEPEFRVNSFSAWAQIDRDTENLMFSLEPESGAPKFFFPIRAANDLPVPSIDRQLRVNAVTNDVFLKTGYTAYRHMSHLFERPGARLRLLDWGCGCGGVGRYFLRDARFDYFGCDIDHDNVAWCTENLNADRFFIVPTSPAESLPLAPMDAIFGISVVSHLEERRIREWGEWLALHLRSDGLLALTTLGLQAAAKEGEGLLDDVLRNGCIFYRDDHEIGRIIGDPEFYGTSYQSPTGLARLLPQFDLVHHGTGEWGHQDLFVFRRR